MAAPISPEAEIFGQTLRAARKSAGFSQEGFAFHCGLDRSYVGQVERGEKNVTLKTIVVLARSLKLEPAELLCGLSTSAEQDPIGSESHGMSSEASREVRPH